VQYIDSCKPAGAEFVITIKCDKCKKIICVYRTRFPSNTMSVYDLCDGCVRKHKKENDNE